MELNGNKIHSIYINDISMHLYMYKYSTGWNGATASLELRFFHLTLCVLNERT